MQVVMRSVINGDILKQNNLNEADLDTHLTYALVLPGTMKLFQLIVQANVVRVTITSDLIIMSGSGPEWRYLCHVLQQHGQPGQWLASHVQAALPQVFINKPNTSLVKA